MFLKVASRDRLLVWLEQDKADVEESTEDNPEEEPPPSPPPVLTAEEITKQKREAFEFEHYASKTLKYVEASEKNQWVVGTKMNMNRGVTMLEIAISKSELYVSDVSKYRMCVRAPSSEVSPLCFNSSSHLKSLDRERKSIYI